MKNLKEDFKSGKTTIVDVRTVAEFNGGHVEGSINIPLQEVPKRLEEIRKLENVVLCCASGGRSAQAKLYLSQQGIPCKDAGSWLNVKSLC